jgi:exodeoxyribonuclease VII large subunit
LSHESILERGFALVLNEQGKPVRQASQAPDASLLDIRLAGEQSLTARVEGGARPVVKAAPRKKPTSKKPSDGSQGQLL